MSSLWKKSYDQPRQHIKKQRHYFANKSPPSQGYGFFSSHVWMWNLDYKESWALKNWSFWMVVLGRFLKVPWTARRSNQSILKEISPGCSLEGLMLKLKFQYFGHLMRRTDSLEKTLILGKMTAGWEGDDRGWDGWIASPTQWIRVNSGSLWWIGRPGMLRFMGLQSWTRLINWTELKWWSLLRKVMHSRVSEKVEIEWVLVLQMRTSLVVQRVKNLPVVLETWVWSLDWEDPLEKGMASHSGFLAWSIPWIEDLGWLQSMGHRLRQNSATNIHTQTHTHTHTVQVNEISASFLA